MDERYKAHRYSSTRLSAIVGAAMMAGWFYYELMVNDIFRWDFLIILLAMVLVKVSAMIFYRFTR